MILDRVQPSKEPVAPILYGTATPTTRAPRQAADKEGKQENKRDVHWANRQLGEISDTHRHVGQVGRAGAQRQRLTPASEGSDASPGRTAK